MPTNDPARFGGESADHVNPFAAPRAVDEQGVFAPTRTGELTLNPWLSIWTRPRETIRQIIDSDPGHQYWLVASLYGMGVALGQSGQVVNGFLSARMFAVLVVLAGPVAGLLLIALFAWAVGLCARLFRGEARGPEMRVAMAWSAVPCVWMLPLSLGMTVYMITSFPDPEAMQDPLAMMGRPAFVVSAVVGTIVWVWSLVISVNTIAEVNRFEWWKALLAILLSMVLFFVLLFVASFVVIAVVLGVLGVGGP